MRIEEAVRSTLLGAAVSMHLAPAQHKSVRIDHDRVSEDGGTSLTTPLTVLRSQDSMAVHRARLTRERDSNDSCRVQVDSDEEEELVTNNARGDNQISEQDSEQSSEQHVQWGDDMESTSNMPGEKGDHRGAGQHVHTKENELQPPATNEQLAAPDTKLSLMVQREDSLNLAHRRMSSQGSPRSRHSTGDISKGDQRRSRFHFVAADLLPTETFHHVTGSIKALYHRSMSLNLPHRRRSSGSDRGRNSNSPQRPSLRSSLKPLNSDTSGSSSFSERPGHFTHPSLKPAYSEDASAEAQPLCPQNSSELPEGSEDEKRQVMEERSPARFPHRSSLKTSMSRQGSFGISISQGSLQACGLETETLHIRRAFDFEAELLHNRGVSARFEPLQVYYGCAVWCIALDVHIKP